METYVRNRGHANAVPATPLGRNDDLGKKGKLVNGCFVVLSSLPAPRASPYYYLGTFREQGVSRPRPTSFHLGNRRRCFQNRTSKPRARHMIY